MGKKNNKSIKLSNNSIAFSSSDKIKKNALVRGGDCPQFPSFSFRYMTTNSSYNLSYCTSLGSGEKGVVVGSLLSRVAELTEKDWRYWQQLPKKQGLETLDYLELQFKAAKRDFTGDETVYIFRFKMVNGKSGRIIGVKPDPCPIIYVIGIDFDYSAYNHGS